MRLLGIPQFIIFPRNPGSRQQYTGCPVDASWLGRLAVLTSASVTFGLEPQKNGSLHVQWTLGWKTDKPTLKGRMFIYGYQDCHKITSEIQTPPSSTGLHIIFPDNEMETEMYPDESEEGRSFTA